MRLYFFPALLPLAPVIPWVLTGLGAVAGILRAVRKLPRWTYASGAFFVAAAGVWVWQWVGLPSEREGTSLTPARLLPSFVLRSAAESASKPTGMGDVSGGKENHAHGGVFREKWFQMTPFRALSTPFVFDGALVVGSFEGTLEGISIHNGQSVWSLKKQEPILATPIAHQGVAFVGEGLHTAVSSAMTAVDLVHQKTLWQRRFLGHIESPPAIDSARKRLYLGSGPRGLWAVSLSTGDVLWHSELGHIDSTPLLLSSGRLFVASQPDEKKVESLFHEVDPLSGKPLWSLSIPGKPWGIPLGGADGDVWLTTGVGQIGELQASDQGWSLRISIFERKVIWTQKLATMTMPTSLLTEAGTVIHTLKNGQLLAMDKQTGSTIWATNLAKSFQASATLMKVGVRELLVATSFSGFLFMLDAKTGQEVAQIEVGANSNSSPLWDASSKTLFVATPGTVAAYEIHL